MRTFIAVEIPHVLHRSIRQQQQRLEARLAVAHQGGCIQWTPPEKVHLTLRFLGETTEQQHQKLRFALNRLVNHYTPFGLSIAAAGGFPSMRTPNIIWLGLQGQTDILLPLQQEIEQLAQAAGFAAERKVFAPHLTIGRIRRSVERAQVKQIGQILTAYIQSTEAAPWPVADFTVQQIVHMQSQLQPAGAVYTVLQAFPLADQGE
ncbi:MAG: RNA 2',3'-cyclic phosphodiesterase [Caldilineaceae bacterium]|nr:RNA 2',3'-cyclic phosphodiesterase [Caldilineaceae bacterium]